MHFVVVVVRLELGDLVLPIDIEDVAILAIETLVDLYSFVSDARGEAQRPTTKKEKAREAYICPLSGKNLRVRSCTAGSNLKPIISNDIGGSGDGPNFSKFFHKPGQLSELLTYTGACSCKTGIEVSTVGNLGVLRLRGTGGRRADSQSAETGRA